MAVCCVDIWRCREKPQYRCTTTIPHMYNSPKDVLENLLPVWLLGCTILFIPSHFWTTYSKFGDCCQRYIVTCRKKVHIYILCPKLLWCNFSNISATGIYTKWCAKTFLPIFGLFAIFDHNFANIVAPSSDKNQNWVVRLKGLSILKKVENRIKIDPCYLWHNTCLNYAPIERARLRTGAWQTHKKHINTIFSHLQPACMVRSPPNFSWW